jgi:hypothetical protein
MMYDQISLDLFDAHSDIGSPAALSDSSSPSPLSSGGGATVFSFLTRSALLLSGAVLCQVILENVHEVPV